MAITYTTYSQVDGPPNDDNDWCCHVKENGSSRLIFFGKTREIAESRAKEFAATQLNSPERLERMRQKTAAAVEARLKRKKKEDAE